MKSVPATAGTAFPGPASQADAAPRPRLLQIALIGLLYFAGAKLGMLTVVPEGMAILWLPNAVVLAALLRFGSARLPAIGVVVIAAEVLADVPAFSVTEALLFGLINFTEASAAFLLLRRLRFDPAFSSLADVWKFFLAGPILAAGCAALLGAAVYGAFRGGETSYGEFARIWWFGDGLGLLILGPLLLSFPPFRTMTLGAPVTPGRVDAVVAAGAMAIVAAIWLRAVPMMLTLPVVLYVAARFAPRWSAVAVAVSALLVVMVMTSGPPPFGALPARDAVVFAQRYLFVLAVLGLGFSTLLAHLRAQQAELERRVAERTAELERANARLAELAAEDALTGLANRRQFDAALAVEAARSRRYGRPVSLVLADLDHFKRINDSLGHAAGDLAIRQFAGLLARAGRAADVVARYGGEEFALLLPETAAAEAALLAERLRAAAESAVHPALSGPVTASFGVAELGAEEGPAELVAAADQALYEAKRQGRNRVVLSGKSRHSL